METSGRGDLHRNNLCYLACISLPFMHENQNIHRMSKALVSLMRYRNLSVPVGTICMLWAKIKEPAFHSWRDLNQQPWSSSSLPCHTFSAVFQSEMSCCLQEDSFNSQISVLEYTEMCSRYMKYLGMRQ